MKCFVCESSPPHCCVTSGNGGYKEEAELTSTLLLQVHSSQSHGKKFTQLIACSASTKHTAISSWSWIIMKCDCLWPWKCPRINIFCCESNPNITTFSSFAFFFFHSGSYQHYCHWFHPQHRLIWWFSLCVSDMVLLPGPSWYCNSPDKIYHKCLLSAATSTQEMFKKNDTYNRENSGVINIIPHTHTSISVNVLIEMLI